MSRPRSIRALFAAVIAWTVAASAPIVAQDVDLQQAEQLLAQRFGRSADRLVMARSIKKILENPEAYGITPQQLMRMFPDLAKRPRDFGIDPRDPEWRQLFQNVQIPPDQIPKDLPPIDPGPMPPMPMPMPMPPDGNVPMPAVPPMPPDGAPGAPPPNVGPGAPPRPGGGVENRPNLTRSDTGLPGRLREIMKDVIGRDSKLRDWARGISIDARRWTGNLLPRLDGLRLDRLTRGLGNILPRISLPSFSRGSLPSGRISVPSVSLPSGASLGNSLTVVVIIVAAGILVWLLVIAARRWVPAELLARWRLGPWPVQPGAVSTRGELVKAFEYLALLNLGQSATASHHKELADRLGMPKPEPVTANRREAAQELGYLYEQARYAPPEEELSPHQLEAARHDLCMLAGVSAV